MSKGAKRLIACALKLRAPLSKPKLFTWIACARSGSEEMRLPEMCLSSCLLTALTCLAASGCSTTPPLQTNPFPHPPVSLMQPPQALKKLPPPLQKTTPSPPKTRSD